MLLDEGLEKRKVRKREYRLLVIVTCNRQKLNIVEREVTLIVTHYWQLLSRIFGETLRIVRNI
jgi:hypothetical protein